VSHTQPVEASEPALFRALPQLRGRVPWLPLAQVPTRVERVRGLVRDGVEVWIKREDQSGALYGGNKVRKLEFLLAEARARGAHEILTLGAIGSHHVLATAIYGRAQGFAVTAVVFPQPLTAHVRQQLLADVAAGATLHPTRGYAGVPLALARRRRKGVAWLSAGGSSPTGTLGWVSAAFEIREQVARGELPAPDVVYVALGSCGTAAGLLLGLDAKTELVAVRVVDRLVANARTTRRLAAATERQIRAAGGVLPLARPSLRVEHGCFGAGYGHATPAGEAAVARAAAAGIALEPTYTGKTMAALLADADAGRLDGKRVLFIQTFNSVDLAPMLAAGPGPAGLPERLRRLFPAGSDGNKH
jgi:1-aminocyclopropane-1-carboxylate deaminase/D-cysteine desulfhydrase-like pyridoxal-dependent ACC family enzyme